MLVIVSLSWDQKALTNSINQQSSNQRASEEVSVAFGAVLSQDALLC